MRNIVIFAALVLALQLPAPANASSPVDPQLKVVGHPPPAFAPYAEDDPIPKLKLKPHGNQDTARRAAESFLARLSEGYDPAVGYYAGPLVGDPKGYEKAWKLFGPGGPSLAEFLQEWKGTVRVGIIQLESKDERTFFVELERVEWCNNHWAVSYYTGNLATESTSAGWRTASLHVEPEHLVVHNIGGHQGWQHGADLMAVWYPQTMWGDAWRLESLTYERRMVTAHVRSRKETGEVWMIRMARTVEGSWVLLGTYHQ